MKDTTHSTNATYLERLVRVIPAEIVGDHLAVQGLVASKGDADTINLGLEISGAALLIFLPFYLQRVTCR